MASKWPPGGKLGLFVGCALTGPRGAAKLRFFSIKNHHPRGTSPLSTRMPAPEVGAEKQGERQAFPVAHWGLPSFRDWVAHS